MVAIIAALAIMVMGGALIMLGNSDIDGSENDEMGGW